MSNNTSPRHNWKPGALIRCIKTPRPNGGINAGNTYVVEIDPKEKDWCENFWVYILQDDLRIIGWNPCYFELVEPIARQDWTLEELEQAQDLINQMD